MSESKSRYTGGIGFWGMLQIAFIVLKLGEFGRAAHWSWWLVLLPTWIPLGVVLIIMAVALVAALIQAAVE